MTMTENKISFTVPGAPQGKGRPRFYNGHAITPTATRKYEAAVIWAYRRTCGNVVFAQGEPIRVIVTAHYPIPKSAPKKKQQAMLSGEMLPTVKPDADNVLKIILDALNKVAFFDDAQITEVYFVKRYAEEPCVVVELDTVERGG